MNKGRSKKKKPWTALNNGCCSIGVEGLDDVLGSGLPRNCFYLIQGDPGSGKTTVALQFLLEGVRRGESVFYVTLSETREELLRVTRSHGWSLDKIPLLELSAIDQLLRPEAQTTVFHSSEVELTKISKLVLDQVEKMRPTRVVFDSLSEFRLIAETPLRYRRELLNLKQQLARYKSTVLLLDDKMNRSNVGIDPHVLSLSHGGVATRTTITRSKQAACAFFLVSWRRSITQNLSARRFPAESRSWTIYSVAAWIAAQPR